MSRPTPRRSALAGETPSRPPAETTQATTQAPTAPKKDAATTHAPTRAAAKPSVKEKIATQTDVVRVGLYLPPEDMDAARGAYLADWQAGGQADTFSKWIGTVIDTHASRTVAERGDLARPVGRSETRTGSTRTFNLAADAVDRMNAAIVDDHTAGRWPSISAWCGDAIAAAVAAARARSGGPLPTPPARLPNRLRR